MQTGQDNEFRIVKRQLGTTTILDIRGKFVFNHRKAVQEAVHDTTYGPNEHLIFNLEDVSIIDSTAIGTMVGAYQKLRTIRKRTSILRPQGSVKQALERCNLHALLPLYMKESDALNAEA